MQPSGSSWLCRVNLTLAVLGVAAPVAHVLELPNKLALDGELWLAVQQHLYRGWGPVLGAPTEIGGLASSVWLAYRRRGSAGMWLTLLACICYGCMLVVFFVMNAPVNTATAGWEPATLPPDWPSYRARWEAGHALAALLSVIALVALLVSARGSARR